MKTPKFITFDCYGTLVDFQLTKTVKNILADCAYDNETMRHFLIVFNDLRYFECFKPYKRYSDMLRITFKDAMDTCGLRYNNSYGEALVEAVPTWTGFPDTKPILDKIGKEFKLVIITNSEEHMMAQNVKNMDVEFYDVITAEAARAYKPTKEAFYYAQRRLGAQTSEILHVAQGFNYDQMPAHALGWDHVWINRNNQVGDQERYGPYLEYRDLTGLPALLGME